MKDNKCKLYTLLVVSVSLVSIIFVSIENQYVTLLNLGLYICAFVSGIACFKAFDKNKAKIVMIILMAYVLCAIRLIKKMITPTMEVGVEYYVINLLMVGMALRLVYEKDLSITSDKPLDMTKLLIITILVGIISFISYLPLSYAVRRNQTLIMHGISSILIILQLFLYYIYSKEKNELLRKPMFESMKSIVITITFIASTFFVNYQSFKGMNIIVGIVTMFGVGPFLSISNINKMLKNR